MTGYFKRYIVLLCLLMPLCVIAQSAKRFLIICPSLKEGTYVNGQMIKNADGKIWALSMNRPSLTIVPLSDWRTRYVITQRPPVDPSHKKLPLKHKLHSLVCKKTWGDNIMTARYVVKGYKYCYVIPDVDYSLFGCF